MLGSLLTLLKGARDAVKLLISQCIVRRKFLSVSQVLVCNRKLYQKMCTRSGGDLTL
jgi:hypothetical protein